MHTIAKIFIYNIMKSLYPALLYFVHTWFNLLIHWTENDSNCRIYVHMNTSCQPSAVNPTPCQPYSMPTLLPYQVYFLPSLLPVNPTLSQLYSLLTLFPTNPTFCQPYLAKPTSCQPDSLPTLLPANPTACQPYSPCQLYIIPTLLPLPTLSPTNLLSASPSHFSLQT